ncbi:hypothetical protein GPOL_c45630 [Gordonia polyisoprenivorans VH2]|uniref:Nucleotidyl transferase n=1 Tax=Gordonia polyisoprenivorans (strain DSM 44266 / VH2) TaxID=1112204 RepID=H6MYD1_GORPV|nr:hypothetical protein [Gordonia polyisoprenivorans]AFA75564.1 hypothetical protein GPOL_c45630 [Gordonia polyisoprenivorans VH2]QUD83192.1 hypothetical protein J8M97_00380 [Gordonia polyisoprenivorans]WCB37059.1 hypothetical protein PHA63_23910 [Gordonia polyisoprenivorans]HCS56502.1 hypothetical protein [Gordonia polyisoprenivorans]
MARTLTASEIRELLRALDSELQARGKAGVLFIVGGAAMALAYNADRATEDVDGTFEPRDVVLQAAASVAAREGDLDPNWLSDGVAQLMPPLPDDHPRSEQIGPALVISIASPEYVLAMKAMVTRKSQGDIDDAVALCHLLSIRTQEALEAVVSRYFPGRRLGAQELFFERIIESL